MFQHILYGDGIHDDTEAIQERIDSGACELLLPAPQKHYLISKPLTIPSNFKLKLPRYATIRLADGANCLMLQSKTALRPKADPLLYYYGLFSGAPEDTCHDFEIEGGIWDFNNQNQAPNPIYTGKFDETYYLGHVMLFYNAKNFRISNLTIKDPANFSITIDTGSYFTVENITFDFNFGNPIASNMDGVHLNGNCHYGVIRNLKGACYDDLVALNAHEGTGGDITHMEIDGIFAENCHSAVRLLTVNEKVEHITISNVFGTYYQYCIGFTKYYPGETTGYFDGICLSNIHAAKSPRLPIQEAHMWNKTRQFPFIWMQDGTVVKRLSVEHLHRKEYVNAIDTIRVDADAFVEELLIRDLTLENHTDAYCPKLHNCGTIQTLRAEGLTKDEIDNQGTIGKLICH